MKYKTPWTKKEAIERKWYIVDVKDQILGKAATKIASLLIGKAKVEAVVVLDGTGVNRDRKVIIYKKRRRKDSKLKRGFRKSFTKIRITKIAA